ncbi:MAG: glycosyltransferase, partial [Methylococcales bacterium]
MFDPNLHYGEDLDWFMRAREKNIIIANIPQFSLTYRLHPGGMTYGKKIPELNVVSVLKKSLDRRRQQQKTPQLFQPIITQQQSLISVIIPAYNAAKYLVESINSVVTQSYSPFEIIVVDDGSKDATAQIAAQFGTQIRYFRQDNAGAGAARNRGVEMAHGHWLAFLDADDVWEPDK